MNLRKTVAALLALFVLSVDVADARGLLDFVLTPKAEKKEYHSGSLTPTEALSLYSAKQRRDSLEACADQFPGNHPLDPAQIPASLKPMALCSDGFAVLYSQTSKAPVVVVERLSAARLRDAKGEERTVGKNKVWKPTHLFKLVYDEATGRAWAYVLPNAESRIERPMDYATFVKTTGLKLLGGQRITGSIS